MLPSAKEMMHEVRERGGVMNTLCDFIIRPPRADYEIEDLGPDLFRLGDNSARFVRDDFTLENMRGMTIHCSWYKPFNYMNKTSTSTTATNRETKKKRPLPCVVYCHANCGSRYDGLEAMLVLNHGFTLVTFDFCGSGWSDGEFISLGFYERQDLAIVTDYLQSRPDEVDGIGFWGRSMGAVTAIMYASKDPSIRCVVCDSPFGTLRWLIQDLVTNYGGKTAKYVPGFVVKMIVNKMRDRIAKRAAFDIDDLDTIKYASECTVPGLIFHGKDDDFVLPRQSERVSESFIGPCLHQRVDGGHNSERSEEVTDLIVAYLRLYMIEKPNAAREAAEAQAKKTPLAQPASESQSVASNTSSGTTATRKSGAVLSGLEVQQPTATGAPSSSKPPPVAAQPLHPHISSSTSSPPRAPRSPTRRRAGVETPPAVPSPRVQPAPRPATPPASTAATEPGSKTTGVAVPPLSSEREYRAKHLGLVKVNTFMTAEPIEDAADDQTFASGGAGTTATASRASVQHLTSEEESDRSEHSGGSSFLGTFVDPDEVPRALPIHFTKPRMDRVSQDADVESEDNSDDAEM